MYIFSDKNYVIKNNKILILFLQLFPYKILKKSCHILYQTKYICDTNQ